MRYMMVLLNIVGSLTINIAYATQHKQVYQSHEGYAKSVTDNRMQQSSFTAQKGSSFHNQYTENPSESNYGNTPEKMTANAARAIDHSPYAKATHTGFNENPPFKINPNDPMYAESKFYMQNAKSVSHGTSDRYVDCKAQKKCRTEMIQHTCEKSQTATLACHKVATPHTKLVTIPPKPIAFNGKGATDYRHEPWHAGASFTFPHTGILRAFKITSKGSWRGHFWIRISPIVNRIDTHVNTTALTYNYNNLNIPVKAGQKGTFYADGREWAPVPNTSTEYQGIIEIPAEQVQESYITWSEVIC